MINTNHPEIDKLLHFRPMATGVLQLAKGEKRSFRNQVACAGALVALPIDRAISVAATPIFTTIEHFEDIKRSKGGMKALKIIATPIWLPINIALKTAVFALFAFFRLPLEIYRGCRRLFKESPEALKREYTGRFLHYLGRYDKLDVKKEEVVQTDHNKITPFSGTEIFSLDSEVLNNYESGKKLVYAMKEAKITKSPFTSIYVVTLGDSDERRPARMFTVFRDGPYSGARIKSIPVQERAKVLVLWELNSKRLELIYERCTPVNMQTLFQWKAEHSYLDKDGAFPEGLSMYFMGRQESANLRYGILSKNLEKALRGSE